MLAGQQTQKQLQLRIEEQGANLQRLIEAQVKAGQALGIPSDQIASGEFFAHANSLPGAPQPNWAVDTAITSTGTTSTDPASTKRARVEVPNFVIVPNVGLYYNSHEPYTGSSAAAPAADDTSGSNQPQGGCIPKQHGGSPAPSMQTSV